jgi:hypothetical protein
MVFSLLHRNINELKPNLNVNQTNLSTFAAEIFLILERNIPQ